MTRITAATASPLILATLLLAMPALAMATIGEDGTMNTRRLLMIFPVLTLVIIGIVLYFTRRR